MFRGWLGEMLVRFGLWLRLDGAVYRRVHDVVVPSAHGTTQIDHILVSPFGIFVIETKNMRGWIFGQERDEKWTQVMGRAKYRFQNPLRQNYRHTRGLAEHLGLDHAQFHSIVFFIGVCRLKTPLPAKVLTHGLATYIRRFRTALLTPAQVDSVLLALSRLKADPALTAARHRHSLAVRFSSDTVCPRCSAPLVPRRTANHEFLGCQRYPRCRFTK